MPITAVKAAQTINFEFRTNTSTTGSSRCRFGYYADKYDALRAPHPLTMDRTAKKKLECCGNSAVSIATLAGRIIGTAPDFVRYSPEESGHDDGTA
jgi:hypothetical protein